MRWIKGGKAWSHNWRDKVLGRREAEPEPKGRAKSQAVSGEGSSGVRDSSHFL